MTAKRPPERVVVVGASAGGIEAVCTVLAGLPADFPFAIFVVVHIPRAHSELAQVLRRCGKLAVTTPRHGLAIHGGCVYLAPPNRHLLIEDSHSCYLGDRTRRHEWGYGCGTCPACELRAKGFARFMSRRS